LQGQALDTVRTIADALGKWPPNPEHPFAGNPSLGSGDAGLAVCFAYLAEGLGELEYEATARRFLERALALAEGGPILPSLYPGLAGIGWAAEHLRDRLGWPELEATAAEIDEALLEDLRRTEWRDDYGLMGGLVGLGVYALERLPAPAAVECLERVINHLTATAEHKPDGATWWRGPERMSLHGRKKAPDGLYAAGLGEGVSGVVALLARACAAGVGVERARPLLGDAARWVLAQEAPDGPPEGFPYGIRPNRPQRNWTRSSWAHGDPGVAVALLGAARCVGEPAWEERARTAALRATTRPPDRTRIYDAGLCIGAAGLGHLFNRLSHVWGEPRLAERSRFWFERALQMRRPGEGIAGYASWMPDENDIERWWEDPGIILGAAGIALALLAAATPCEPAWDRLMLVQVPAPPHTASKTQESIVPDRVGPAI
jgi:hypothetical protein